MADYDHRRRDRKLHRRRYDDDDYHEEDDPERDHPAAAAVSTHKKSRRRDDRSRSRSPVAVDSEERKRRKIEAERTARMARLRAENEQEETRLSHAAATGMDAEEPVVLPSAKEAIIEVKESEMEGLDEEEQMQLLLGFTGGFGTTKNSKVEDNHKTLAAGAAKKNKARKYRQYMNRKGGFNRPLEKMD
jgi:U4/U6.U5 tri-snRNP-associated protein 3